MRRGTLREESDGRERQSWLPPTENRTWLQLALPPFVPLPLQCSNSGSHPIALSSPPCFLTIIAPCCDLPQSLPDTENTDGNLLATSAYHLAYIFRELVLLRRSYPTSSALAVSHCNGSSSNAHLSCTHVINVSGHSLACVCKCNLTDSLHSGPISNRHQLQWCSIVAIRAIIP